MPELPANTAGIPRQRNPIRPRRSAGALQDAGLAVAALAAKQDKETDNPCCST